MIKITSLINKNSFTCTYKVTFIHMCTPYNLYIEFYRMHIFTLIYHIPEELKKKETEQRKKKMPKEN